MAKNKKIVVTDIEITITEHLKNDYICLTDIAKGKEGNDHIRNWMRNRNTVEFLGLWESINNNNFKGVGFDTFRKESGLNAFNMTPKKWIEGTNAIGIISKSGRYGGTYAHKDIAFEFASWLNPVFKLWLIKEFQRLKEQEHNSKNIEWDVKRMIAKANYRIHTDAVKDYIIPEKKIPKNKEWIVYANESDMISTALFGFSAKQWKNNNPSLALKGKNMRDYATIEELTVLSNLESFNAEMIKVGATQQDRFLKLRNIAESQLRSLRNINLGKDVRNGSLQSSNIVDAEPKPLSSFNNSLKTALNYNPKEK